MFSKDVTVIESVRGTPLLPTGKTKPMQELDTASYSTFLMILVASSAIVTIIIWSPVFLKMFQ